MEFRRRERITDRFEDKQIKYDFDKRVKVGNYKPEEEKEEVSRKWDPDMRVIPD